MGTAWSPTDLFSPPNASDPTAIRPGVVAALVQIPVGPLDSWSVAAADDIYGVRRRGYFRGTDWAVIAGSDAGDLVMGADAKGDLGSIGWHGASAYRFPEGGGDPLLAGLIGADSSWLGGGLSWLGEYHIESAPVKGTVPAQAIYQQLTYRLDDFTSFFGWVKADLAGGGATWVAGATTLLGAQSELMASVAVPTGKGAPSSGPVVAVRLSQAF